MSKLGAHLSSGPRTGFGAALQQCAAAGSPVPILYALDQNVWADLQAYSPSTRLIFRTQFDGHPNPPGLWQDDPVTTANDWYDSRHPRWLLNFAHYYSPTNEYDPQTLPQFDWANAFDLQLLRRADADGLKLAIGGHSTGTPSDDGGIVRYQKWQRLLPSLQYAKAHGHLLLKHEYGFDTTLKLSTPHHALRYRDDYNYLRQHNADPLLVISEASAFNGYSGEGLTWLDDAIWYDTQIMQDKFVIGCCLYQLGGAENWSALLLDWADYVAAHPTPRPPEPPPVGCRGAPRTQYKRVVNVVTSKEAARIVLDQTFPQTVTNSYDDAGIGDLDARTAILWNIAADKHQEFLDWYATYYPGVVVQFRSTNPTPPEPFWVSWPVEAYEAPRLTDPFNAPRSDYPADTNRLHEGIDTDAYVDALARNAKVLAAQNGIVEYVKQWPSGYNYGLHVVIRHPWGSEPNRYRTLYAHLSSVNISVGQAVTRGQVIGVAGMTGTKAIHLHFNVHDSVAGLKGYYRCPDCAALFPDGVIDPETVMRYEPEPQAVVFGVHARADGGDLPAEDYQTLVSVRARVSGYKFMTSCSQEHYSAVVNGAGINAANCLTRLFYQPAGARPAPAQFVDLMRSGINTAWSFGVRWFELLNEVNLFAEWPAAWGNAAAFVAWAKEVLSLLRSGWNGIKVVSPGLAPVGDMANVGQNTDTWIGAFETGGLFAACDVAGAHAYWRNRSSMTSEVDGLNFHRYLSHTDRAICITEFSNNQTADADLEKGQQYRDYVAYLAQHEPRVLWAYCYVMSSSGQGDNDRRETWTRNGVVTDIPRGVLI